MIPGLPLLALDRDGQPLDPQPPAVAALGEGVTVERVAALRTLLGFHTSGERHLSIFADDADDYFASIWPAVGSEELSCVRVLPGQEPAITLAVLLRILPQLLDQSPDRQPALAERVRDQLGGLARLIGAITRARPEVEVPAWEGDPADIRIGSAELRVYDPTSYALAAQLAGLAKLTPERS